MDGREVMEQVVADDNLNHIPVVVLTTSSAETDILAMYKLRCSSYITKPSDFNDFLNIIRLFGDYWLSTVTLPPTHPPPRMET
jgi:two-component system, chemotaxis family, response regulator Rcp1